MSETLLPASFDGSVILDIGGEIGALVLHTSRDRYASEIDLVPDDLSAPHVHSAVRERRIPTGSSFAAVYPQLQEGRYTIVGTTQRLLITGGRVAEVVLDEDVESFAHDHHHSTTSTGEHHVY
ncbi:MAG: hypothetical protein WA359_07550 [Acidimicrobiales bacterium]